MKKYDFKVNDNGKFVPDDASLGDGNFDFSPNYAIPLEQVKRCAAYLKNTDY